MAGSLNVIGLYDGAETGCNYYRLIMPFAQLKTYGFNYDWIELGARETLDAYYNVVTLIRPVMDAENADAEGKQRIIAEMVDSLHASRAIVSGDLDDDFWNISEDNPVKHHFTPEKLDLIRGTLGKLDFVTVSTDYLKQRVLEETDLEPEQIEVIPNLIDFDLYDNKFVQDLPDGKTRSLDMQATRFERLTGKEDRPVTIGLQGGASHFEDWKQIAEPLKNIWRKYGNKVRFVVAGFHPDYLVEALSEADKAGAVVWEGWKSFQFHPTTIAEFDINLCPLNENEFNLSKSAIKYLEASAVGAASIVSPTVYGEYVRPGLTGLVAQDSSDFEAAISYLVENRAIRQNLGTHAHIAVRAQYSLQSQIYRYIETYQKYWHLYKPAVTKRWMVELQNQQIAALRVAA